MHCGGILGDHPLLINNKFIEAGLYPLDAVNYQQVDNEKTESKEAYTAITFLSGSNHSRYGHLMNKIHKIFRMGQNEYPKDLTSAYDLAINWKCKSTYMYVPDNSGVDLLTDDRGQDGEVHATDGTVITTRDRNPVECHICIRNN